VLFRSIGKRGRPEKYTKDGIMNLVGLAKSSGKSLKNVIASLTQKEKEARSPQEKKRGGFRATVSYVPMLVAAARLGISLRAMMKHQVAE